MKKVLGCIIIMIALFTKCSNNDEKLNNESIIYQKGKIKIILLDINEGRCPTNVDCIWQRNTEVGMRITNGTEAIDFILNTAGYINDEFNFPNNVIIFDLDIKLIDLKPYPKVGVKFSLEDYKVSLSIN